MLTPLSLSRCKKILLRQHICSMEYLISRKIMIEFLQKCWEAYITMVRRTITLHGLAQTDRWIRIRRTMPLRRPNSENSLLYIINAVRKRSYIKDVYLKGWSRNTIPQVLPLTDSQFRICRWKGGGVEKYNSTGTALNWFSILNMPVKGRRGPKIPHLGWRPSWMTSYTLILISNLSISN